MKFIHISDLHIGKRVHEFSMIEDQKYILNQIIDIVKEQNVPVVLIAGDVYDKAVPSAEAVQLFDTFLTALAQLDVKVCVISGNHDSAERIAFGAQLMKHRGVYMSPVYDGSVEKVVFEDDFGTVNVYLLPFLKPAMVRHALEDETITTYPDALKAAVEHMEIDVNQRNVLVAHQFVTGASRCESEEVSVGGLDNVDADIFKEFDYVALGHIHSPQSVTRPEVRYCGTPLKYSFSEAGQEKSITLVDIKQKGEVDIQTVSLKPLRDLRKLRGTYEELMNRENYMGTATTDYVHITLTDEDDVPDGMQRLRSVYPNLMRLEYDNLRTRGQNHIDEACDVDMKSELELFEEFFEIQNNQAMSEEQKNFSEKLIEELLEK